MRTRAVCLAGVSLLCVAASAHADPAAITPRATTQHPAVGAAATRQTPRPGARARAAQPAARAEELSISSARHITVAATSVVTRQQMDQAVAGTSPFKILAETPGVNFTSDDALGLDTWSVALYVRGFTKSQLGVTLDGVPLGDQGYQKYNGLDINAAVSQDNIANMTVSQGGGAVDVPSTTNLGGAIQFQSRDPSKKAGGEISQMFGSFGAFRTFVRLDSGELNHTGTRFYASYMRTDTNKWKGAGTQFQQQVNFKLYQPIREKSHISAIFDWSDMAMWGYADLSFNALHTLGQRADVYYPDYTRAYLAAAGQFSGGVQNLNAPLDAFYYDGGSTEENFLGAINVDLNLTDNLDWKTVLYGHSDSMNSSYTDPYDPSPNGSLLSEQLYQPWMQRFGFTSGLSYNIAHNNIDAGVWYENNSYKNGYYLYQEPVLGQGSPLKAVGPYNVYGPAFDIPWLSGYHTNTFQFHLQDTYYILPTLSLSAGFRSFLQTTGGGATYNNEADTGVSQLPSGSLTTAGAFLPHVAIDWHFARQHEVYFDMAENMRGYNYGGYQSGSLPSAWQAHTQADFETLRRQLKPETSWDYTLGYRFTSKYISAMADLYRVNYYNRMQAITTGTLVSPHSTVTNVGRVNLNGLDAQVVLTPIRNLSISNTLSYAHSVYGDNLTSLGTVYQLKGKHTVAYPSWMYKAQASYTYHNATVHMDASYIGKRYFSYTNDMSVPSYWLVGLGTRYQFQNIWHMKSVTFDFNIYNLLNHPYIATIGESGFPLSGDRQSILAGEPRGYFGSVKVDF